MLKLEVTPIHTYGATCIEDTLITVANYWGLNHILAFAEGWRFEYDNRTIKELQVPLIGNKFKQSKSNEMENLEKYVGLIIKNIVFDFHAWTDAVALIKNELSNQRPVVASMDGFWIPWDNFYQQEHYYYHFLVITGYDEQREMLICAEPYHGCLKDVELPLSHYQEGFGTQIITLAVSPEASKSPEDWRAILRKSMMSLNGDNPKGQNSFEDMERLAVEIEKSLDIQKEFTGYKQMWYAPMYASLEELITGRIMFLNVLNYFASSYNVHALLDFNERFEVCTNKWQAIKSTVVKSFLIGKTNESNVEIAKLIREQIYLERELASDILIVVNDPMSDQIAMPTTRKVDIAMMATVSCSSEENNYDASNIIDGLFYTEWKADNETTTAWVRLTWEASQRVNKVIIYDSTFQLFNLNSGILKLSTGLDIVVEHIPNDGTPKEINFPTQTVDWIEFRTTGGTGDSVGMSLFKVFHNE